MNIQKVVLGLGLLTIGISLFPSKTERALFKKPRQAMTIQASKKEPPRIAFEELNRFAKAQRTDWDEMRPGIDLNQKIENHFVEKPQSQRRVILSAMTIARPKGTESADERSWVNQLPREQQRILQQAQMRSEVLDKDWSIPSLHESLREELQKIKKDEPVVANKLAGDVEINPNPIPTGSRLVHGRIQLEPGLGLGNGRIVVRYESQRAVGRAPSSQGKVILESATGIRQKKPASDFEVAVSDYSGVVVASLISETGEKIGEGQIKLASKDLSNRDYPEIVIKKVYEQVIAHHVDLDKDIAGLGPVKDYGDRGIPAQSYFASFDTEKKSDSSGRSTIEHVANNSWSLVRSELDKYVPSLNLVASGRDEKIPMMKTGFRNALLSLARDNQNISSEPETGSIVWGRALFDGKTSAGVRVEVEQQPDAQVLYFNTLMIPDPNLKTTSENGYFAIVHLPEGLHSIVSKRGENYFAHANIVTEPETMTHVLLEASSRLESTDLSIFDAFQGLPMAAHIEIQSMPAELTVDGQQPLYFQPIHRLGFMNVKPVDPQYLPALILYSDDQANIPVPLIREDWLLSLRRSHRIDDSVESGTIVGFINENVYDVYLSHEPTYEKQNIVYFDARGEIMPDATPGGGFVLFNVPSGTQSIVLVDRNSQTIQSRVLPVDSKSLAILNF